MNSLQRFVGELTACVLPENDDDVAEGDDRADQECNGPLNFSVVHTAFSSAPSGESNL